jgi:Fe-S-cluster containining protein
LTKIFRHTQDVRLTSIAALEPFADVPCGSCNACCRFLAPHLTPSEISSGKYPLSLINGPEGPVVTMWKDAETGGCAMFKDNKCSIYEDRPVACRQFDCRKGHHPKTNKIAEEKFGIIFDETRENSSLYDSQE